VKILFELFRDWWKKTESVQKQFDGVDRGWLMVLSAPKSFSGDSIVLAGGQQHHVT
jgi:hypothetical protein